jgi:hypothetical protein
MAMGPASRVERAAFHRALGAVGLLALPGVEHLVDVLALRPRERCVGEQAARFGRVVVLDRGLEVLAAGKRLAQLAPEPAKQADTDGIHAAFYTPPGAAMQPLCGHDLTSTLQAAPKKGVAQFPAHDK